MTIRLPTIKTDSFARGASSDLLDLPKVGVWSSRSASSWVLWWWKLSWNEDDHLKGWSLHEPRPSIFRMFSGASSHSKEMTQKEVKNLLTRWFLVCFWMFLKEVLKYNWVGQIWWNQGLCSPRYWQLVSTSSWVSSLAPWVLELRWPLWTAP